jgi:hypothetical protein
VSRGWVAPLGLALTLWAQAGGAQTPPPAEAWRLQGTVLRDESSTAYIADAATNEVRSYRVGDPIGDGVVEAIEEHHVLLRTPRGPIELRMEEQRPARQP